MLGVVEETHIHAEGQEDFGTAPAYCLSHWSVLYWFVVAEAHDK